MSTKTLFNVSYGQSIAVGGPQGIRGEKGDTGSGDTGPKGEKGDKGDFGDTGPSGLTSVSTIGATPNANGLTLNAGVLNLEPASASFGGVVTTSSQTIAGAKTFSNALNLQSTLTMPNDAQIRHVGSSANMLTSNAVTNSVSCGAFSAAPGNDSSVYGSNAGRQSVGIRNTFLGSRAGFGLSAGDTGNNNVSIGYQAGENLANVTQNIVIGANAARSPSAMTTNNVIIGFNACTNATNGRANNIVIGSGAGASLGTTSDNNIYLGSVGAAESNTIRIGTQGTQTTTVVAGISGRPSPSGVAVLCNTNGQLGTTASSSRFKNNINSIDSTFTSKIYDMRVVSFIYNEDPTNKLQYGLIAEEVELVMPEICVYDSEEPEAPVNTVQYLSLIPILLKEIQVQKNRIDALETQLSSLLV